jgi:glycosyltransferase involved in cell wall biosynthesis
MRTQTSVQQSETETAELSPGWYLVEGAGFEPSQRMHLVFESAMAKEPRERLPLRPVDAGGRLQSVAVLAHGVRRAWLALDDADSLPRSGTFVLRRISRMGAMIRMLSGLRTGRGAIAWKDMLHMLQDAAVVASSIGISRAAGLVVSRYLFNLRAYDAREDVSAGAMFRPGAWPVAIAVRLQSIKHLQPAMDAQETGVWEAVGEDPCFRLVDHGAAVALKAGWYRLRARILVESGAIIAPALYPDYGQGYVHDEMIRLPDPGDAGQIDVLILLKHDVHCLRFDPTIRRARFAIHEFELSRLGQVSALLRMVLGLRCADGSADWRKRASALIAFIRTACTHGISAAASDLFAEQPYRLQTQKGSYADWIRRYDTIGKLELDGLKQRVNKLADGPMISLILPVYQTPEAWLRRCLDSVLQQAYPNWELCIADDASPDPLVREVLEKYASRDARIKVVFRASNGHIAEASNSALQLATGEFIGLLDHDDELRPHALLEMAEAIAGRRDLGLLYSDEDKIDADGRRFDPYFKPDWNPDLLLSQNYVCHFTVIRTALVRAAGGFRKGFEGSQDHDLILRCTELLAPGQIHHVPKVLYHWRAIEGSTALVREAKDYASAAGVRAVAGHLRRTAREAAVEELPHGHYRVRWPVPASAPKVSIIIPTRDRVGLLRGCVESIRARTDYPEYEIVIVDNQSIEAETVAYLDGLRDDDGIRILSYDASFNYSAINNWAASQCSGTLLCLLNNDIEVIRPDWLSEMAGQALRPEVGAVGAMLYYPDGTIQHAGVILGIGGVANHAFLGQPAGSPGHGARALVAQDLSAVTGACMVVRRDVYERVGGLDEQLQVAFNDIDFCLRVQQAGYRVVWTPFAELCHHESASRGSDDTPEKRQRFVNEVEFMQQRWGEELLHDPAYNPNLSLESPNFDLAFPPRNMRDADRIANLPINGALP